MQTSGPWDPWLPVVKNSRLSHSAGTAHGAPPLFISKFHSIVSGFLPGGCPSASASVFLRPPMRMYRHQGPLEVVMRATILQGPWRAYRSEAIPVVHLHSAGPIGPVPLGTLLRSVG